MKTNNLAGIFIFLSLLTTIYSYFYINSLFIVAGIFAWIATLMLFKTLSNLKLVIILFIIAVVGFIYSYLNHFEIDYAKILISNQYLLTLLIGVGFLKLIAMPKQTDLKELPSGKNSFLKTYLGVHLFGSVINLSSLVLVGDRMFNKAPLSNLQLIVLTRSYASDAYWSPFFVAFAAASTYAPNLSTMPILFIGFILAIVAFLLTYFEVSKKYDFEDFRGYPIQFETLYLPFLLALMVILTHHFFPNTKVIVLIALYSLVLTILILPIKFNFNDAKEKFFTHITSDLPKMKNEISLFLFAGMFGVSASSILIGHEIQLPFSTFDASVASLLLLVIIILSFVSIHPIITIAIIGNWMPEVNHTLLAITFLMSWSIAMPISPFNGLNLTMQSKYDLTPLQIPKVNFIHAIQMYIACVVMLFILDYLLK